MYTPLFNQVSTNEFISLPSPFPGPTPESNHGGLLSAAGGEIRRHTKGEGSEEDAAVACDMRHWRTDPNTQRGGSSCCHAHGQCGNSTDCCRADRHAHKSLNGRSAGWCAVSAEWRWWSSDSHTGHSAHIGSTGCIASAHAAWQQSRPSRPDAWSSCSCCRSRLSQCGSDGRIAAVSAHAGLRSASTLSAR